jgi:hypothetical protein
VDKWKGLIIGITWLVLGGVIVDTLLHFVQNGVAKSVLVIGLCVAGIITIPLLLAQFFNQQD